MAVSTAAWARTNEPLLWLDGAARETRCDTAYRFDCSKRADSPHIVLQMTVAGAGYYRRGRAKTLLAPGMAFLETIPGPFHYGYPPGGTEPYELLFVSFRGPLADEWRRRIIRSFGHVLNLRPDGPTAAAMALLADRKRQSTDRYLASARLYELLMTLMSELSRRRTADTRMDWAMRQLTAAAGDARFSITALAGRMDCSREHFSRRFRAAAGVGPHDYLMQHRLRMAARLLREQHHKLDVVARACGLGSANYLCRVFRRRVGVTPAQFRAQPWLAGP